MVKPQDVHGAINHAGSGRKDSLIRVTLKAVIFDGNGNTLVVKEHPRDWWDIPGGGIEHGETMKEALKRELYEEVSLRGDFEFETLLAEDPHYLESLNLYQMRITFLVRPHSLAFSAGDDGDEVRFVNADLYEHSELWTERQIYRLSKLAKSKSE